MRTPSEQRPTTAALGRREALWWFWLSTLGWGVSLLGRAQPCRTQPRACLFSGIHLLRSLSSHPLAPSHLCGSPRVKLHASTQETRGGGSSALEPRAYPLCSDLCLLACLRSMSDSCGGEQPLQTHRLLRPEVAQPADTPRKQLECVSVLSPVKPLPFRTARSFSHFHTRRAPVDGSTAKRHRVWSPPLRCRVLC